MNDVTIRDATVDDVTELMRVTEQAWAVAYGEIFSRETIDATMEELRESDVTRQLIERDGVAYFVAEHNKVLVGYLCGGPSNEADVAILGALYVVPDHWNNGIGTALLNEFEAFCRQHGYDIIQFRVLSGNDIGISFYRKHGYTMGEERETDRFDEPATERIFRGPVE